MKRALIAVSAVLIAAVAAASETTKPAPAQTDSPLVKAAKSTKRDGTKKRIVITNESLKNSTGHITTTTIVRPVYMPPRDEAADQAMAEKMRAQKQPVVAAKPAEAKKADETNQARMRRLSEEAEDPYTEMDPAQIEAGLAKTASEPKPEPKKP